MRTVCGQFCGIFGGFFAVVGPILQERCLSQVVPLCLVPVVALPRATNQCALCSNVHLSRFLPYFSVFFRGGSNMVAFRAKVGRTWQPKFQRRLRNRAASLPPSGLPNLPFSLVLPFPPLSSNSLPFSLFFSPIFLLFTPLPLPFPLFFPFFPTFSSTFPSLSPIFCLFPDFFGQSDASLCNFLANFMPREAPHTSKTRHVVKVHFCIISRHFWAHPKNEGPIWRNAKKGRSSRSRN